MDDKDPILKPDKTPNDGNDDEETTSGNPFTSTPGPSGERPREHIRVTTYKGEEKEKEPKTVEASLIEGNVPPKRVLRSAK